MSESWHSWASIWINYRAHRLCEMHHPGNCWFWTWRLFSERSISLHVPHGSVHHLSSQSGKVDMFLGGSLKKKRLTFTLSKFHPALPVWASPHVPLLLQVNLFWLRLALNQSLKLRYYLREVSLYSGHRGKYSLQPYFTERDVHRGLSGEI